MPINLKIEPLPKYNKDEYLKKFLSLVFKHAPEFDSFLLRKLPKWTSLSDIDKAIFFKEKPKIQTFLIENNLVTVNDLKELKFTDKKRKYKSFKQYLNSLKPKPFWKKPEFILPFLISILALFNIDEYLFKKEKNESINKLEVITITDSISKELHYRQDSLLQITNNRIFFLKSSLDSLLIKNHSLKNGGMNKP